MKLLYPLIIVLLFISGCTGEEGKFSSARLKEIVSSAASGNMDDDALLSGLFKTGKIPGAPEEIKIDSIVISDKKYFGVAVTFSDPLNNRFALYDENLSCYIIDRSINGKVELTANRENNFNYFSLTESYYSNDSIELKRFSMYRGDTSGFKLAFRTFTMMKTTDILFLHNLYEIKPDIIKTNITAPLFSGINNLNDDYAYNKDLKVYFVKRSIYFDEFVTDFINSIADSVHKFVQTAAMLKEDDVASVFEFTSGYMPDYYLSLTEDWKELRNKSGSHFLKRELIGSKFVNEKLKSDIYVFRIPYFKEAEEYINAALDELVSGKYTVRYSEEEEFDGYIKKYFEYTCRTKKFILILSAAADAYEHYTQEYTDIINTFYINC